MAAAIKEKFGINVKLIEGSKGIFDVKLNGTLIFSKDSAGRFPEHDEVLTMIPS